MKTNEDIHKMLVNELEKSIDKIRLINKKPEYYKSIMGDTSFLLAGLLNSLLKEIDEWDTDRWIDDSLLLDVGIENDKILIWGVMISGRVNTTEQWTDPFYFEMEFLEEEKNSYKS